MVLLQYSKHRNGLHDPKGSLSFAIPLPAIYMANRVVLKLMTDGKKCRLYKKYSLEERCRIHIGQYACNHGVAAATHFSRGDSSEMSESPLLTHEIGNTLKKFPLMIRTMKIQRHKNFTHKIF